MKISFGGNSLTRKKDKKPIYSQTFYMPKGSPWNDSLKVKKKNVPSFIKNLYEITMDENGFSYFLPYIETGNNISRFEWHYGLRGDDYFLRVGVILHVKNSIINKVNVFYTTNKFLEKMDEKENVKLTDDENDNLVEFIESKFNKAIEMLDKEDEHIFNIIRYVKLTSNITELFYIEKEFALLPAQKIDNEIYSALVIPVKGNSYLSCVAKADERANMICAIISLLGEFVQLKYPETETPSACPTEPFNKEILLKNLDLFYPNGEVEFNSMGMKKTALELNILNSVYKAYVGLDASSYKKLTNIIFTYYTAKEAVKINKTLALVSHVACLDAIAKDCNPDFCKENGARKAIVNHIKDVLSEDIIFNDIDKWSKRIFNDHRSSYVHGATIRFSEYSQNMDGKNFQGLPNALPTETKPYSKQYEYENDLEILVKVNEIILLKYIEYLSNEELFSEDFSKKLDFSMKFQPEAYVGLVNQGWHCMGKTPASQDN